jgi:hypothetical protein
LLGLIACKQASDGADYAITAFISSSAYQVDRFVMPVAGKSPAPTAARPDNCCSCAYQNLHRISSDFADEAIVGNPPRLSQGPLRRRVGFRDVPKSWQQEAPIDWGMGH